MRRSRFLVFFIMTPLSRHPAGRQNISAGTQEPAAIGRNGACAECKIPSCSETFTLKRLSGQNARIVILSDLCTDVRASYTSVQLSECNEARYRYLSFSTSCRFFPIIVSDTPFLLSYNAINPSDPSPVLCRCPDFFDTGQEGVPQIGLDLFKALPATALSVLCIGHGAPAEAPDTV